MLAAGTRLAGDHDEAVALDPDDAFEVDWLRERL
jgi:hypothetical protein